MYKQVCEYKPKDHWPHACAQITAAHRGQPLTDVLSCTDVCHYHAKAHLGPRRPPVTQVGFRGGRKIGGQLADPKRPDRGVTG